jgi:RNA 2',3'-cyclic 3'-phosphodiesterase
LAGDERIRLFCALQLPAEAVDELAAWQAEHLSRPSRGRAANGARRIVPPGNLHVTLAFLGSRPVAEVPVIAAALAESAREASPADLRPTGYRETRSVGMIVYEDAASTATALAGAVAGRLEELGVYRRERRPWLPHVTVLRFKEQAGLTPDLTNICSFRAVRTALYSSTLRPGGAQYEALETAALGGR